MARRNERHPSDATEEQAAARRAAIRIHEEFESYSDLRTDSRDTILPLFDPDEVLTEDVLHENPFSTVAYLRGISCYDDPRRKPLFDDDMEDARDRLMDRSHDGHFAVKYVNPKAVLKDKQTAADAAAALMIEAKILMNLAPHPHICQLYGMNANGTRAIFGCAPMDNGFYLIIDSISETLPQRMAAWRERCPPIVLLLLLLGFSVDNILFLACVLFLVFVFRFQGTFLQRPLEAFLFLVFKGGTWEGWIIYMYIYIYR